MRLRSAILCLLISLNSCPAASCPDFHPITRKSLSGLWEGIEPLGLSVFLVEVGVGHRNSAVLVREGRTVVFRLEEPKVDTKGNVSLNGREVAGATTIRITGSGDATDDRGFLFARVVMGVDSKKNPLLAKVIGDETHDIYFLRPGGSSALQIQRAEDQAKTLLSKEQKASQL